MSDSPFGHQSRRGDCYATWYTAKKATDLAGKCGFRDDEVDDLAQELRLYLLRSWPAFDAGKSQAITFIHRMVNVRAQELIRERRSPKRDYRVERPLSAAAEHGRLDGVRGQPDRSDHERTELRADCVTVLALLPAELRRVAELLREMTPTAAARALGIPESTMRRRVAELRERFIAAGYGHA